MLKTVFRAGRLHVSVFEELGLHLAMPPPTWHAEPRDNSSRTPGASCSLTPLPSSSQSSAWVRPAEMFAEVVEKLLKLAPTLAPARRPPRTAHSGFQSSSQASLLLIRSKRFSKVVVSLAKQEPPLASVVRPPEPGSLGFPSFQSSPYHRSTLYYASSPVCKRCKSCCSLGKIRTAASLRLSGRWLHVE